MDRKTLFFIVGVSVLLLLLWTTAMGGYCPGRGSLYGWNVGYGMMGGGMGGIWLLIVALLVVLGVFLFSGGNGKPSPKKILDERLARGEISKEQYEELKKMLGD